MQQHVDGLYYALLEGPLPVRLRARGEADRRRSSPKYSALLLPNIALLSDEQCRQIARLRRTPADRCWRRSRPACYNERNERRADFGLADVFGIHKAGEIVGTNGNAYMARIEKPHPILEGFAGTHADPGRREPRARSRRSTARSSRWCPATSPIRRSCPTREPSRTTEPAIVVRETGRSRAGLLPRRHRSHDVAIRPHRPGAAAAELDPLGRRSEAAGHDRGRRRDRDVRLGDRGRASRCTC